MIMYGEKRDCPSPRKMLLVVYVHITPEGEHDYVWRETGLSITKEDAAGRLCTCNARERTGLCMARNGIVHH
jgi:hypothetical protein